MPNPLNLEEPTFVVHPPAINELRFVDADIRALFGGSSYPPFMPLIVQLNHNIAKLLLVLQAKAEDS